MSNEKNQKTTEEIKQRLPKKLFLDWNALNAKKNHFIKLKDAKLSSLVVLEKSNQNIK